MGKSHITRVKIEDALERILNGKPIIIPSSQKLSVKAVEEEAGLGSGSVYYYQDIINKIKECSVKSSSNDKAQSLYEAKLSSIKERLKKENRLKERYRSEVEELKKQLSNMASQHNQLALMIEQYQYQIAELEAKIIPHKSQYKD
jgi:chromosome segregation ATPase